MQRIPKKNTSNKWDAQRRIQTEANDDYQDSDINALMQKYKKNIGDYNYQNNNNTNNNLQGYGNTNTNLNYKKNTGSSYVNRKSNGGGHSVDKLRKSANGGTGGKNSFVRNMNFNRSLVTNNENYRNSNQYSQQNNKLDLKAEYYQRQSQQQQQKQYALANNNNNGGMKNNHDSNNSQMKKKSINNMNRFTNNNNNQQSQQQRDSMQYDPSQRIQTEPAQTSQMKQQQIDPANFTYQNEKVVGSGTFGVVYKAKIVQTGQIVAIKKVLQDKRYKNRELQILQELNHPNVLKMVYAYYSQGDNDETYLHVVMQYIPETIYSMNRHYIKQRQYMPSILVKLYSYQIMRSLVYIHTQGICHRDIKPHNILVDPQSNRVVLCDFGSAKKLVKGEPNISYICSRCYRAPELIFGATDYSNQIDMWSTGCVIAEIINGEPLFIGESAIDQLVEIIKVLGTPTKEQVLEMNPNYDLKDYKFPMINAREWKKVLRQKTDPVCLDFVSKVLVYSPIERLNPLQAIAHPYFDELRDEKKLKTLSTKIRIPNLFDFTKSELNMAPELTNKVIPDWYFEKYGIKNKH